MPYHFFSKIHEKVGSPVNVCTSRQILETYSWNFVKLLSASYEHKNMSTSNGEQLKPIVMPIVCWNIHPPNSTCCQWYSPATLWCLHQSIFAVHQNGPERSMCLTEDNILKATVIILVKTVLKKKMRTRSKERLNMRTRTLYAMRGRYMQYYISSKESRTSEWSV